MSENALQASQQVADVMAKAGTAAQGALLSCCSSAAPGQALRLVHACCQGSDEAAAALVSAGLLQVSCLPMLCTILIHCCPL